DSQIRKRLGLPRPITDASSGIKGLLVVPDRVVVTAHQVIYIANSVQGNPFTVQILHLAIYRERIIVVIQPRWVIGDQRICSCRTVERYGLFPAPAGLPIDPDRLQVFLDCLPVRIW